MFFLTGGGYSSAACADVNAKEMFFGPGQFSGSPLNQVLAQLFANRSLVRRQIINNCVDPRYNCE